MSPMSTMEGATSLASLFKGGVLSLLTATFAIVCTLPSLSPFGFHLTRKLMHDSWLFDSSQEAFTESTFIRSVDSQGRSLEPSQESRITSQPGKATQAKRIVNCTASTDTWLGSTMMS